MAGSAAAESQQEQPLKKQRGTYTNWFSSSFIREILSEYELSGYRAATAVARLKKKNPSIYEHLSHSSLIGWFDKDHKLLPHFQAHLDSGLQNVRQNGPTPAFEEFPAVEEEIKEKLLRMRAAGTAMNSHIIGWVMRGVIDLRAQGTRLQDLKLGQQFVCAWARKNLKWSWRKSTTAASKLPLDWEEQGLNMAKRIACIMEHKEVS
jgi:hypothetical protein